MNYATLESEFHSHGAVDAGFGVEGGLLDGLVQEIAQFEPVRASRVAPTLMRPPHL